jgi:hypothetical protein
MPLSDLLVFELYYALKRDKIYHAEMRRDQLALNESWFCQSIQRLLQKAISMEKKLTDEKLKIIADILFDSSCIGLNLWNYLR